MEQMDWATRNIIETICFSPEQPLGPVVAFWGRYEYQQNVGNLPHFHSLIWTTLPDADAIDHCSASPFLDWGFESDLAQRAFRRQVHKCDVAMLHMEMLSVGAGRTSHAPPGSLAHTTKCARLRKDGKVACRFCMPFDIASSGFFMPFDVPLSEETCAIFERVGLQLPPSGRWFARCAVGCRFLSPYWPEFVENFETHCNMQVCDDLLATRYCPGYLAGKRTVQS
eukprot:TRINITY_DN2280_c0_g1_i2.p2 TRINITY_DN2280_c0_g1~~TRINITY_DN2280_c0_g1_i2.p2  ORF type:complete len:225 (+),score=37.40 TRINITY_DN2280_c0_g1_i2:278-952(+)